MLSAKRFQLSKVNAIGATPFDFKRYQVYEPYP